VIESNSFETIVQYIREQFLLYGKHVDVGEWQSLKNPNLPHTKTFEIEDISFKWSGIQTHLGLTQMQVKPNLPWAEDHFQERVSGEPLNPGEQYKNWPWYEQGVEEHKQEGQFSHTYMERYWAATTPEEKGGYDREGIRFKYGDLGYVMQLLSDRPNTRQAYLPMWFPEDGYAALINERVPCSLGYHFLARKDRLKVVYYMRSCDWFRYFRDDIYLTTRLLQWVAERTDLEPASVVCHISSLHIFSQEQERLEKEHAGS